MADLSTPSAAIMTTMDATEPVTSVTGGKSPIKDDSITKTAKAEKPDEEIYKKNLEAAEAELKAVQQKQQSLKQKLDSIQPGNKDSPTAKRRAELMDERSKIIERQSGDKAQRLQINDKKKRFEEQKETLINEQKLARSKLQYRTVAEIDEEIKKLQDAVGTGKMRLVDEKKALADVSSLTKQKKQLTLLDDSQSKIDDIKTQIAEQKKLADNPDWKADNDRYAEIKAELDQIKAEQDVVYKDVNNLRDERTRLHEEYSKKHAEIKKIKDDYYHNKKQFYEQQKQSSQAKWEKRQAEREAYQATKVRGQREAALEEASTPAYTDEILTGQGLIQYFDPSSTISNNTTPVPGKFAVTTIRTVDPTDFQGMTKLASKKTDAEDYFVGATKSKKHKSQHRHHQQNLVSSSGTSTPSAGPVPGQNTDSNTATVSVSASPHHGEKFHLSLGVLEQLAKLELNAPASKSEVPSLVEELKKKVEFWKGDQDRKTKENIEKAKAELDKIEKEDKVTDHQKKNTDKSSDDNKSNSGIVETITSIVDTVKETLVGGDDTNGVKTETDNNVEVETEAS